MQTEQVDVNKRVSCSVVLVSSNQLINFCQPSAQHEATKLIDGCRKFNEVYVCSTDCSGAELKELCRRFAGTTRPLTNLREMLSVKEFVQLLDCFPDLRKSAGENELGDKPAAEGRNILIYFTDDVHTNDVAQNEPLDNFTEDSEFKFHAHDSATSSFASNESTDANDADSESSSHCDIPRPHKSRLQQAVECLTSELFFWASVFVASALLARAFDRSDLK